MESPDRTTGAAPAKKRGVAALLAVLRRHWIVVLLPLFVVPAVAGWYTARGGDEYEAVATVLLVDRGADPFDQRPEADRVDVEQETINSVTLANLDRVAEGTARRLGGDTSASDVAAKIDVDTKEDATVLEFQAVDADPERSAAIADAYATEFVATRARLARERLRGRIARVRAAVRNVERRLAALPETPATGAGTERATLAGVRDDLLGREEQLRARLTLETGDAEIVQSAAVPTAPTGFRPRTAVLFGLALGLLIGVGLAFLFEALDRGLRDADEAADIFGRPVLGAVPRSPALTGGQAGAEGLEPGAEEAFAMLRANLQHFRRGRDVRSLLVTSSASGDGKTTIAWHLARSAAASGRRVLLVEGELRRPMFARRFGVDADFGLTDVLEGQVTRVEATVPVPARPAHNGSGAPLLHVIPAGRPPGNPSELLESPAMAALIREAEADYDLVVVDAPPLMAVADAVGLVRTVAGVLVVTRLGDTTREAGYGLDRQLRHLDAHVLGLVINGIGRADDPYAAGRDYHAALSG